MQLELYIAACVRNTNNCSYLNKVVVSTPVDLATAVAFHHVCAKYKGDYRSVTNLEGPVVLPMDCDNYHSDLPEEWVTLEKMAAETDFGDISFAAYPSKSKLLPKGNKSARPRNHYLFVIENCTSAEKYAAIKRKIQEKFPFFDANALDAARFFYGNEVKPEDVFWNEGGLTIEDIQRVCGKMRSTAASRGGCNDLEQCMPLL